MTLNSSFKVVLGLAIILMLMWSCSDAQPSWVVYYKITNDTDYTLTLEYRVNITHNGSADPDITYHLNKRSTGILLIALQDEEYIGTNSPETEDTLIRIPYIKVYLNDTLESTTNFQETSNWDYDIIGIDAANLLATINMKDFQE